METAADTVVFDIGGVVLDWDPAHLYRSLIPDERERRQFLSTICTLEWHAQHDAGRSMAETIPELCARHPRQAVRIIAWRDHYCDMVRGYIPGMVELLEELHGRVRLLALTNMPAEVVGAMRSKFGVLEMFDGMLVSGQERLVKPDPAIFDLLAHRFGLNPPSTVFVDDFERNIMAARRCDFEAILFRSAYELRIELQRRRIL